MRAAILSTLTLLLGCDTKDPPGPDTATTDSGDTAIADSPLSIEIQATCEDGACSSLRFSADSTNPLTSWVWAVTPESGNPVTADTDTISVTVAEGLSTITLDVTDELDQQASAGVTLVVNPVTLWPAMAPASTSPLRYRSTTQTCPLPSSTPSGR